MHRAANPMPRHGRNVHGLLVGWVLARTPIARRHDARAATAFVPPGMKVVRSSSLHIAGFAREKINDEVTLEEARVNPMTVFAVQALLAAASRATPDEPTLELETIFGLNAQKFFVQVVLRTVVREDDPLDELAFTSQAIQRLDNVHLFDRNEIITDVVACAAHQQRSRALEAHGAMVARMPQATRHHFTDGLPLMPVRVSQYVPPRG